MAGARITVDLDDARVLAGLAAVRGMATRPGPLLRQVGVYAVHSTQERFRAGTDPSGTDWAPLNPVYAASKRGRGILVGLGMSGGLQGSITSSVDGSSVTWGSNKVYAAIHQFGGTILPKKGRFLRFRVGARWMTLRSVTIKPRPYLGLSAEDAEEIAWLAGRFAAKLIGAAG